MENDKLIKIIGDEAARNFFKLTEIIIKEGVKQIPVETFRHHPKVTSVIIPNSVTRICRDSFACCEELESINLPNGLLRIGTSAFFHCIKLKSIIIPPSVNEIGGGAFSCCWDLSSVTILGSVLPEFLGCHRVSSITIGENLQDFTPGAFGDCKQIKSIVVDKNNKYLDSRDNCNAIIETSSGTLLFACNSTKIPEGIKHISRWAFGNCGRIKTLSLPGSLESIDGLPENVKKIIVPKGRKREFRKKLPRTRGIELVEK